MFRVRILSITHKVNLREFGVLQYIYATGALYVTADSRAGADYCKQIGISGKLQPPDMAIVKLFGNTVNDVDFDPTRLALPPLRSAVLSQGR